MITVSLVGGAKNTRHLWENYPSDEIWTLSYMHQKGIPADRLFEMHSKEDVYRSGDKDRWEYLKTVRGVPVYMLEHDRDIPMSVQYPLDAVMRKVFRHFYLGKERVKLACSTLDYMLGLTVWDGVDIVNIFGFELSMTDEWFYQKPSAMYYLGVLNGLGVNVFVPEGSELVTPRLYGYDGIPQIDTEVVQRLDFVRENLMWR